MGNGNKQTILEWVAEIEQARKYREPKHDRAKGVLRGDAIKNKRTYLNRFRVVDTRPFGDFDTFIRRWNDRNREL